jgi:pilus retraction protein PilT
VERARRRPSSAFLLVRRRVLAEDRAVDSPVTAAPASAASFRPSPLDPLLAEMVEAGASDLFLAEGRSPAWRIDGLVTVTLHPPTTHADMARFMASTLRPAQIEAFERTGDVDLGRTVPGLGRFRMHFHLQRGGLGVVVRSVPRGQLAFEALGLPAVLRTLADLPRGLVLVTGATGSGKSTTLAAMVHHINSTHSKHIVTLEDPIEFVHEDLLSIVTQREIGSDTRDFAVGLRHVVRESPDVILVGEMRDAETMSVALSAALTGHLVLSSPHTEGAARTLQRVLGYFPDHQREQVCLDLSLCLQGVVAQRLLPRARADEQQGRVAAVEVLVATPAVRRLIREQRVEEIPDVMGQSEGMESFQRALARLYRQGLIAYETGAAYATDADEFRMSAQGAARGSAMLVQEHEAAPGSASADVHALLGKAIEAGASDLHLIDRSRSCHIITIEDPIEFVHESRAAVIEQRELGADTKSFAAALRHILRQDPDVILVGELRDPETIAAALTAAETGHLVLGTLHSNDAPQTVDRIVDVFPPHQQPQIRAQLAAELLAVVAQRLLPRADGAGRVAAFEVLVATAAARTQIREGKIHQLLHTIETSRSSGMTTFERSLAELVRSQQVTQEAALRLARSKAALDAQLSGDKSGPRTAAPPGHSGAEPAARSGCGRRAPGPRRLGGPQPASSFGGAVPRRCPWERSSSRRSLRASPCSSEPGSSPASGSAGPRPRSASRPSSRC